MNDLLRNEIAKVQSELTVLRDEYLPVLFARPPVMDFLPELLWTAPVPSLSAWQQAVTRLADLLPLSGNDGTPLDAGAFKEFMFPKATPGYWTSEHGIRWQIKLFTDFYGVRLWCWPPCLEWKDNDEEQQQALQTALPEIKKWLMLLSVDQTPLLNALCFLLPFVADIDPPFAKLALDPETWRSIVSTRTDVSDQQREEWLANVDHGWFRQMLHNALLHVLGALANNHFAVIRDYLGHPCLYGHYTRLMPQYLFTVLVEKVSGLRQLVGDPMRLEVGVEPARAD